MNQFFVARELPIQQHVSTQGGIGRGKDDSRVIPSRKSLKVKNEALSTSTEAYMLKFYKRNVYHFDVKCEFRLEENY